MQLNVLDDLAEAMKALDGKKIRELPFFNCACAGLGKLVQRRPAHAKPDFNWLSGPRNGTWKRTCGISCRSRYKHESARNEPSPKVRAGKRQEPATNRYKHETARSEPSAKVQAGKRQEPPFPSSNVAICDAATPGQHPPILRYSALLRYSVLCFNSITQCNWHDIETMAE